MEDKIREILKNIDSDLGEYEGDDFFQDGVLDSFRLMEVITELEENFDIEIDSKDTREENFKSVSAITNFVKGK